MDLLTTAKEQLPWLLVLVLPGFISIRVFELLVPSRHTSTGRETLEALSYGAVNFAVWSVPLLYLLPRLRTAPFRLTLLSIGVLVLSPALLAVLTKAVLSWPWAQQWFRHPVPTAWDFFFAKRRASWMRVRLRGGHLVGGFYGGQSFASSDPDCRDLYLETAWRLDPVDGKFLAPATRSLGLLISLNELEYIELFTPEEVDRVRRSEISGAPRPRETRIPAQLGREGIHADRPKPGGPATGRSSGRHHRDASGDKSASDTDIGS